MLTMGAAAKAICAALHEQWPAWDIHERICPAQFERPAALVEWRAGERRVMNRALYEETGKVTVSCFGVPDEYGAGDADELTGYADTVRGLFSAGFLPAEGRAVRLRVGETVFEADRCKTTLDVSFVEALPEEDYPLMREIHSKTRA